MLDRGLCVANSFSLNMVAPELGDIRMHAKKLTPDEAKDTVARTVNVIPAIGHADLARIVARDLGLDESELVEAALKRPTITIGIGDQLIVCQYRGPRLQEGATRLPDGAAIEYWHVAVSE